jgi:hypothetical protein
METEKLVKIAVISVGGYLVYRYVVQAGMIPDFLGIAGGSPALGSGSGAGAGSGAAQGAGQGTGAGAGAGAQQGQQQAGNGQQQGSGAGSGSSAGNGNGSGPGTQQSVRDQVLTAAGTGAKHFWRWNFYHPNKSAIDPFQLPESAWANTTLGRKPANVDEVEATPLTFEQYWSLVTSGGFAGLVPASGTNVWDAQPLKWIQ